MVTTLQEFLQNLQSLPRRVPKYGNRHKIALVISFFYNFRLIRSLWLHFLIGSRRDSDVSRNDRWMSMNIGDNNSFGIWKSVARYLSISESRCFANWTLIFKMMSHANNKLWGAVCQSSTRFITFTTTLEIRSNGIKCIQKNRKKREITKTNFFTRRICTLASLVRQIFLLVKKVLLYTLVTQNTIKSLLACCLKIPWLSICSKIIIIMQKKTIIWCFKGHNQIG
jgi:hypothetical protein